MATHLAVRESELSLQILHPANFAIYSASSEFRYTLSASSEFRYAFLTPRMITGSSHSAAPPWLKVQSKRVVAT